MSVELLKQRLPFLNIESGLEVCMGDEGFYLDILHAYLAENCLSALNDFYIRGDWRGYRIRVHALKSSSLHVGADEVSALAKKLEYAARDDDMAYIHLNHYKFLWEYEALLKKVNAVFMEYEEYKAYEYEGLGRLLVMVVDDNEMNRDIASHILESEQYSVMALDSGEEAIKAMNKYLPDIVLLDIHMPPGINGYEVMNIMQQDERLAGIPVVIMTGDDDDDTELKGLMAGAQDFIAKPFNKDIMMARVRRIIELDHIKKFFQAEVLKKTKDADDRRREAENITDEIVKALASTIDAKDKYTKGHSERVAQYAVMLATEMGYTEKELRNLKYTALLHDIGKIGVPDEIINKTSRLTDEEYDIIKTHSAIGYDILKNITQIPDIATGARSHHERFDGRGYPDGLEGSDIKEIARIIGVADAYDAMTSNRSYRRSLPQDVVRAEILKGLGSQFDPTIGNIMIDLIDKDENYLMRDFSDDENNGGPV